MEREFGPVRRRMYTRAKTAEAPEYSVAPSKREYVIVDGYNFIFGTPEYKELAAASLSLARERLSDVLRSYRAMRDCELVLVFDGYRVAGNTGERETHGIRTVYTKENETADMYIERPCKRYRQKLFRKSRHERLAHSPFGHAARAFCVCR